MSIGIKEYHDKIGEYEKAVEQLKSIGGELHEAVGEIEKYIQLGKFYDIFKIERFNPYLCGFRYGSTKVMSYCYFSSACPTYIHLYSKKVCFAKYDNAYSGLGKGAMKVLSGEYDANSSIVELCDGGSDYPIAFSREDYTEPKHCFAVEISSHYAVFRKLVERLLAKFKPESECHFGNGVVFYFTADLADEVNEFLLKTEKLKMFAPKGD